MCDEEDDIVYIENVPEEENLFPSSKNKLDKPDDGAEEELPDTD